MLIMIVPIAGFMVVGKEFYALWQPVLTWDEIKMIQLLSIIACFLCLFIAMTQCCIMVFSVVNKLRVPVLVNIGIGLSSMIIVLCVLKFGGLGNNGIYVIAGVSSVLMSLRTLGFVPMYAAKLLGEKITVFYPEIIRGALCFVLNCGLFYFEYHYLRGFFGSNGWFSFLAFCLSAGVVGYIISALFLFGIKDIKKVALNIISK